MSARCPAGSGHYARPRHSPGYTLIEALAVMALVALILGTAAVRLSPGLVGVARNQSVAYRLAADMRFAQSEAITAAANHYLLFTDNGSKLTSYAVFRVEDGSDVQVEATRRIPDDVALTSDDTRAEFETTGSALANYAYNVATPDTTREVSVVLSTGAVQVEEVP